MTEKKKRKSWMSGKNIVLMILLFAIIAGFYMNASNGKKEKKQDEYTILKEKDLVDAYPETPREVVKLYGRIVRCLYKDGMSQEQVETLVYQLRKLFSDDLLRENPLENQLKALDYDMKNFHKENKAVISYRVDENSLKKGTVHGKEAASVILTFSVKKEEHYTRANELFLLRKNYIGNWKIVGWQLVDKETKTEEKKTA